MEQLTIVDHCIRQIRTETLDLEWTMRLEAEFQCRSFDQEEFNHFAQTNELDITFIRDAWNGVIAS